MTAELRGNVDENDTILAYGVVAMRKRSNWRPVLRASGNLLCLIRYLGLVALLPIGSTAVRAQGPESIANCSQEVDRARQIEGCTFLIQRGIGYYGSNFIAWAYTKRGWANMATGERALAVSDYSKAIKTDPKYAPAYLQRAEVYIKKGDWELAIADYTKAIEAAPTDSYPYNSRGIAFQATGDARRAIADHSKAIELNPDFADAYSHRCSLRAELDSGLLLGLVDCDNAIRLKPDDAEFLDVRGFVYLRLKRFNEAMADLDAALKIDPKMDSALYTRGLVKKLKGDLLGANADIAAAKALSPEIESWPRYSKR